MAITAITLLVPGRNGDGAWVDASTLGPDKTIIVGSGLDGVVTVEVTNEETPTSGAPLASFRSGGGEVVVPCVARWMRASVAGFKEGSTTCTVAAQAAPTRYAAPVAPVKSGAGAGVDASELGDFKTATVRGPFRGAVNLEASNDGGSTWAQVLRTFTQPGLQSGTFTGELVRAVRTGVPDISPGRPIIGLGGATPSGGGSASAIGVYNVADYGAQSGVGFDNADAFAAVLVAAQTYVGGGVGRGATIVFPDNAPYYTSDPFVVETPRILLVGAGAACAIVRTNAGSEAVYFDGGAAGPAAMVGCGMVDLGARGVAGVDVALRLRSCHHSVFRNVLMFDTAQDGLFCEFGVGNIYENVRCTVNEIATSLMPQRGIYLTRRNGGEDSNACAILQPCIEGVLDAGIVLAYANLCTLVGGISESNQKGLVITEQGGYHNVTGLWGEDNATSDIDCNSHYCTFIDCKGNTLFTFGALAYADTMRGGIMFDPAGAIHVTAGARGICFDRVAITDAAHFVDAGTATQYNLWSIAAAAYITGGPYAGAT